jgi:hypothetical protein
MSLIQTDVGKEEGPFKKCVLKHQNTVEKRAFASFRTRPAMLQGIHFIQKPKRRLLELGIPIFCIIAL